MSAAKAEGEEVGEVSMRVEERWSLGKAWSLDDDSEKWCWQSSAARTTRWLLGSTRSGFVVDDFACSYGGANEAARGSRRWTAYGETAYGDDKDKAAIIV